MIYLTFYTDNNELTGGTVSGKSAAATAGVMVVVAVMMETTAK